LIKEKVVNELSSNVIEIIQNPFGNYSLQYILKEWGIVSCRYIVNIIINNISSLSMQKFSSNVVETCIEMADKVICIDFRRLGMF
jgi:hypothetical protein